ncbi:MAG: hypothetical protein KDK54_22600, partial [Leptospiraceae bacterium]|nr:hypothetical protein [Leptospiraceae bacterium]
MSFQKCPHNVISMEDVFRFLNKEMSFMLLLCAVKTKERRGGIMFVIQIRKNYFLGEKRNTINIEDAKRFSSKKEADSKLKETW